MDFWQKTINEAVNARHHLHQHPETAWQETQTAEYVRAALTALDIPWQPCTETGTVAVLGGHSASDKNIALRADIDALPIHELNQFAHRSNRDGYMHACGHDGHTATLLAATGWLKQCEANLPHKVTLLFQPAEEGGHGAKKMIEAGALEQVTEIFGWHNWPAIPFGQLYCPDKLVMCGNGVFHIDVTGIGGHASQPEQCQDPVLAASAIHLALQTIISRRLPPQTPAVVSVTSIHAESGLTTIPERAQLAGSIRVADEATRQRINQLIEDISHDTAKAYGVTCEVRTEVRYQATINHPTQAGLVRGHWHDLFGQSMVVPPSAPPVMASEDFSYYLKERPGAFALIGGGEGANNPPPCHSANYDFNDKLIPKVAKLFCALVNAPIPE